MSKNYKPKSVQMPAEVEEIIESVDVVEDFPDVIELTNDDAIQLVEALDSVHVVVEGDTYALLGKQFAKSGESAFAAAKRIMDLNGNRSLTVGSMVKI